jgi:hypothetical protein
VESKRFDLYVEGGSTGLRIGESSRGITRFIALNGKDSRWLLDTLEELLAAKDSAVFWRRSHAGFPSSFAQRCANKHGRFLMVENYGEGRRRSFILVPEGRKGAGWKSFRSELSSAVKFMGTGKGGGRPPASLSLKPPSTGKLPEPPRRRSYAETVSSPSCVPEPTLMRTSPNGEKETERPVKTKRPEKEKVQKPRWPVTSAQPVAPKSAAVVPAMGRPVFSTSIASFLEGDQLSEFKDTLLRIKGDVERCINWLESGRSPPSCGLLGAAPKPNSKIHFGSSSAGGPAKKKQKSGLVVSRPKVFKHAMGKRGPVFPICKPAFKPNRVDKGKAVVEGPRPTSSKTSKKKWVSVQPTFSGATHVRALVANPGPATGMDLSDGLLASSSSVLRLPSPSSKAPVVSSLYS